MADILTPKEQVFAHAYTANGGNGKAAALEAGYTEASAAKRGSELIRRSNVKKEIEFTLQARREQFIYDERYIDRKLLDVSEQCLTDGMASNNAALIALGLKALDMMCKRKGYYAPEKVLNINMEDVEELKKGVDEKYRALALLHKKEF